MNVSPLPAKARLKRELRNLSEKYRASADFSKHKADQLLADTYLALCEAVNSPVSLGRWLRFKYKEHLSLVSESISHLSYNDSKAFMGDYLVSSFLSKYTDFDIGVDREKKAFDKWLLAESKCSETNDLFRARWSNDVSYSSFDVEEILHLTRREIQQILGEVPSDILEHGRFGPGSDMDTYANRVTRTYKYSSPGSCTPGVQSLIDQFDWDDVRAEFVNSAEFTNCSRLAFVPKTSLVDRSICVEPRWNIFFQLSVKHCMDRRLKVFGFDSSDQGKNVELARRAYSDGLSTIDLSSASDCVAKNLVLDLLPEDWCDILFKLRCPVTVYWNVPFKLEKIASMGNGYTFPLETLIFGATARATARFYAANFEDIAVYGDDIIVPEAIAATLIRVLEYMGFSVNQKKTFTSGTFFESCGSDFFKGQNVRPIFLKERISNVERTVRLANQITEFSRRYSDYSGASARFFASRNHLLRGIPKELRFFGPPNAGDGVVHAPFDASTPYTAGNGWQGYYIKSLMLTPMRFYCDRNHLLLAKLSGPDHSGNYISRRDALERKVGMVYVLDYEDFAVR